MKPGERVRWAESFCRLEALKAKETHALAVYETLRREQGYVLGSRLVGGVETLLVDWDGARGPGSILPAELLERALP